MLHGYCQRESISPEMVDLKVEISVGGIPNSKEVCICKVDINYHLFFAQALWQSTKVYLQSTEVYVQRPKVHFQSTNVNFQSRKAYFQFTKAYFQSTKAYFQSTKLHL